MENIYQHRIAVVGLGYVGLPLALLADRKGYSVVGLDTDENKIMMLRQKLLPYHDEHLADFLKTSEINFTTEYEQLKDVSIIVICVPTPVHDNHTPDLGPVRMAARRVGGHLQRGQLIVLESTVNPGVSEEVVLPILEEWSELVAGQDFFLAHCPERINPGDSRWHVGNIPRVVGSLEPIGLQRAVGFYRSIVEAEIFSMTSLKEAEAVKIVENSFRDINIAFVNELAMSFSRLGIDVVNVIKGAATKPFAFMPHFPSCGVGGHCIPVDPYYLIEYAQKNGFSHDFLSLARKINNHMPEFTVERLIFALNEMKLALNGLPVAVLGLAYKANIDDVRESPAFSIVKHLEDNGASVRTYDPQVPQFSTAHSLREALHGARAVVLATAHNEFRTLSPEQLLSEQVKVIIDGCNCLPKEKFIEAGLVYKGIGR